jgi:nucleotide-binding universal stress UspA family protein
MSSFRKLLLCYDGTREGRQALCEGAQLARHVGAEAHLLAILDGYDLARSADVLVAVPLASAEQVADDILREGILRLGESGLAVTGHVVVGNPVDEIPRWSAELNADLVVVGHHRRGAFARWWNGRDDGRLLDRLSCAVLVVHAQENVAAEDVGRLGASVNS